ncbi:hypothetical protein Misp05_54950 [Micromonospora sp. NBRC 107095]|nr:hypothetical protein Misp05_54950 [Micromonospora sp. NBRC 107095]
MVSRFTGSSPDGPERTVTIALSARTPDPCGHTAQVTAAANSTTTTAAAVARRRVGRARRIHAAGDGDVMRHTVRLAA